MASGSPGTPSSQRTGAVNRDWSTTSRTRSRRPGKSRSAGRCTCSGVDRCTNPASSSEGGRSAPSVSAARHVAGSRRCRSRASVTAWHPAGMGPTDDRERIATGYRRFAEVEAAQASPLYAVLATAVAEDDDVLDFLAALPTGKRQPNLLFAAVQYLHGTPTGYA